MNCSKSASACAPGHETVVAWAAIAFVLTACGPSAGSPDIGDGSTPEGAAAEAGAVADAGRNSEGGAAAHDSGHASDSGTSDAGGIDDAGDDGGGAGQVDLSGWQLQLPTGPTGNPDVVSGTLLSTYKSPYFFVDTDAVLNFMDPTTGTTTGGSVHPRSELRELTSGWSAAGTNTLSVRAQVPTVPSNVTIGQIFQASPAPSKPLLELEYFAGGTLKVLIEKTNQGGSSNLYDVGSVTDGAELDYVLSLSGGAITITVDTKVSTFALPATFQGESFYFKCGDYDQTATAGTPGTTPGTIVKLSNIRVVHK